MSDQDILLGIIPGPVWKDRCNHTSGSYIASYECLSGANHEKIDLYVFQNKLEERQNLCLRYGDEDGQYYSPGTVEQLLLSSQWEPHSTARAILRARGRIIWQPKGAKE